LERQLIGGKIYNMKKLVASFYKYYCLKKLDIPYFRSIMTLIGFFFMHFLLLFAIFPLPKKLNPFAIEAKSIIIYGYAICIILLLYIVSSLLFRKKELEKYTFTTKQLKVRGRTIVIYFFALLFLLGLSLILKVRTRW
jgi:hypothetical protein